MNRPQGSPPSAMFGNLIWAFKNCARHWTAGADATRFCAKVWLASGSLKNTTTPDFGMASLCLVAFNLYIEITDVADYRLWHRRQMTPCYGIFFGRLHSSRCMSGNFLRSR